MRNFAIYFYHPTFHTSWKFCIIFGRFVAMAAAATCSFPMEFLSTSACGLSVLQPIQHHPVSQSLVCQVNLAFRCYRGSWAASVHIIFWKQAFPSLVSVSRSKHSASQPCCADPMLSSSILALNNAAFSDEVMLIPVALQVSKRSSQPPQRQPAAARLPPGRRQLTIICIGVPLLPTATET